MRRRELHWLASTRNSRRFTRAWSQPDRNPTGPSQRGPKSLAHELALMMKLDGRESQSCLQISVTLTSRDMDPFKWWMNEGKKRFPGMVPFTVKYLAIPAAPVLSERHFSAAGRIIADRRSNLSDSHARMLPVLHSHPNFQRILTVQWLYVHICHYVLIY